MLKLQMGLYGPTAVIPARGGSSSCAVGLGPSATESSDVAQVSTAPAPKETTVATAMVQAVLVERQPPPSIV